MCKKWFFVMMLSLLTASSVNAELVAWWRLDETAGGIAHDSSGNGNDGTLMGDPQWVAGKSGGGLEFNGSSDYVEVPFSESLRVLNQGDFSFAAWFRPDEIPTEYKTIFQQGDDAAGGPGRTWLLVHNSNDIRSSLGGAPTSSGVGIEAGEWYHGVVVVTEGGDTDSVQLYVNGEPAGASREDSMEDSEGVFYIGTHKALANMWYGLLDDIRIYNHALSEVEIWKLATGPKASKPDPADGTVYEATWANISWATGADAVSHDLYIGESFEDVNAGAEETFQGNYAATSLVVGFAGFPVPGGLIPGTTYYWRIDEVNDADPNSPWVGDVWSFTVPSITAYNNTPADGAKNVLDNVTLSWAPGLGAQLHQVYFGNNFDDVSNASGAPLVQDTTFVPGALEPGKTYYWRVDEFESGITHKGDVWSFSTVPEIAVTDQNLMLWWTLDEGAGATAVDWSGHGNHGAITGDAQWTDGYQGTALSFGDDVYVEVAGYDGITGTAPRTCCAWIRATTVANQNIMSWAQNATGQKWRVRVNGTGGLRAEVEGGYHYGVTNIADGLWHHVAVTFEDEGSPDVLDTLLYVDGRRDATAASQATGIDTAAGPVRIGKSPWYDDSFMDDIDDARIYDKVLTAEEIQQVMLGDTKLAGNPVPERVALVDTRDISSLSWSRGDTAASHDVYFGIDRDAVAGADNNSPEFQGNQAGANLSLAGLVEFGGGDYYWRIDEVEADGSIIAGTIWKFTVPDYLIVDNFESYDNIDPAPGEPGLNRIFDKWIDGFGTLTNGALVGNDLPPYAETNIVHGGAQSMIYRYDNVGKTSEATLTLTRGDWAVEGVAKLSLWLRGDSANSADRIYVALNGSAVVYHDDAAATQLTGWKEWVIDLATLGINLTNVQSISIGIGTRNSPAPIGGTGTMYFDDIRLIR